MRKIRDSVRTSLIVDKGLWSDFLRIHENGSEELRRFIMMSVLQSKIEVLENVK